MQQVSQLDSVTFYSYTLSQHIGLTVKAVQSFDILAIVILGLSMDLRVVLFSQAVATIP